MVALIPHGLELAQETIPKRILVTPLPAPLPVALLLSKRWKLSLLPLDEEHCLFLCLTAIQASKPPQNEAVK